MAKSELNSKNCSSHPQEGNKKQYINKKGGGEQTQEKNNASERMLSMRNPLQIEQYGQTESKRIKYVCQTSTEGN